MSCMTCLACWPRSAVRHCLADVDTDVLRRSMLWQQCKTSMDCCITPRRTVASSFTGVFQKRRSLSGVRSISGTISPHSLCRPPPTRLTGPLTVKPVPPLSSQHLICLTCGRGPQQWLPPSLHPWRARQTRIGSARPPTSLLIFDRGQDFAQL
ncbi:hypothetical protein FA95DRAFT_889905 [Auriscalpium vulgare]|uniref:Uncharacterized protein n=1 Tax=Auriscalpium vulgare TaxID=40419 RepID=A0ACB8RYY8_9AGAM|nr:hypothetical protein FA95DRAFT_889905 [Auriscalpium vulgare]